MDQDEQRDSGSAVPLRARCRLECSLTIVRSKIPTLRKPPFEFAQDGPRAGQPGTAEKVSLAMQLSVK